MSYDPDPDPARRRRRRRPRLRRRRLDPDPARRRRSRRRLDPDPERRRRWRLRRPTRRGLIGFLDKWSYAIGGLAGFFLPKFSDLQQYYAEIGDPNYSSFWGAIKAYFQWNFLRDLTQPKVDRAIDKLTNPNSHHGTFFGSFVTGIVLAIISILPIPSKFLPRDAKRIMGKLGSSLAVGTALGAVLSHWQSPPTTQYTAKPTTNQNQVMKVV